MLRDQVQTTVLNGVIQLVGVASSNNVVFAGRLAAEVVGS